MSIPYIKDMQGKKVLMVHQQPFILLAGEVHNSNSSSVEYMESVWDKAEALGMNSLLLPVSWEMVEPEEGRFCFALVDGLIEQARRRGKKLMLLWFGSWKNAQCYYAPEWVKTDLQRFKRAQIVKGKNMAPLTQYYDMPYTSLSYLCEEAMRADAKAFGALTAHIRQVDEAENTVVAVQVENEVGLQGAAREQSDEADALFAAAVPQDFAEWMRANTAEMAPDVRAAVEAGAKAGSWAEVFGEVAEELFSAYHIARYVNTVAQAGKDAYSLPMVANCWLDNGQQPGQFPTGGPVARVMEVWHYCAPNIEVLAPDIYARNFCDVCDEYTKRGNPLLIPETATHSYSGPRQVYVVGHHHAMGYAPFGFENMGEAFTDTESYLFGVDVEDPALSTPQNIEEYRWYTTTLDSMKELLAARYGTGDLQAVLCERKAEDTMLFGSFGFTVTMGPPMLTRQDGVCLVLKIAENEFFVLANGSMVRPFSANPEKPNLDVLCLEEGRFENGEWETTRRLNGDEVAIKRYEKCTLLKMKLFAYS